MKSLWSKKKEEGILFEQTKIENKEEAPENGNE
jgi:hypothetical protein